VDEQAVGAKRTSANETPGRRSADGCDWPAACCCHEAIVDGLCPPLRCAVCVQSAAVVLCRNVRQRLTVGV